MANLTRKRLTREKLPESVIEKWNFQVLDEGFVPFPKRLLRCLGSVFNEDGGIERLAVVLAVADYRRPNLIHPPSVEYLAFIAGLPVERFRLRLAELHQQKLVTIAGSDDELEVGIDGLLKLIQERTND